MFNNPYHVNKQVGFISESFAGKVSASCDYKRHFSLPRAGNEGNLSSSLFSVSSSEEALVACGRPSSSLCSEPKWWWLRRETPSPGTTCCTFGPTPSMTCAASGPKSFMANSAQGPLTTSVSIWLHTSKTWNCYHRLNFELLIEWTTFECLLR